MTEPVEMNGVDHNAEEETPVVFRKDRAKEPHITAVFPCEPSDYAGYNMTCYAHVGQHSGCSRGWYNTTRAATPEEYADLKAELESIGYKLRVYKRVQPSHHAVRHEAARAYREGVK